MSEPAAALRQAVGLHQQGQLGQAEGLYRQVLSAEPENLDALNLLGILCQQTGRASEARDRLTAAIRIAPDVPELHNTLGLALGALGDRSGAIAAFQRALELNPDLADALQNLAAALGETGVHDQSITHLAHLTRVAPQRAGAHFLLGRSLHLAGRVGDAVDSYRRAVELEPGMDEAWKNLGVALLELGSYPEAAESFDRLARLWPKDATAEYHVGLALDRDGRAEEASKHYERAIALDPNYVQAHNNLGVIRHFQKRIGEAIEHHRTAMQIRPEHASAHANLGFDYWAIGRVDEAMAEYRRALELDRSDYQTHSNLLMALHYGEEHEPPRIFKEHLKWARQHAMRFEEQAKVSNRSAEADPTKTGRKIHVGYVSSNFREHAVAIFFEPIIANHDHTQFEIFCYSDVQHGDEVTARIARHADQWRQTRSLSDEQLAQLVREDRIDILVDLNGHIAEHRLLAFARKPAPIQVTYLGYPDTTGLGTMDYRLTDAWHDRPGMTDRFHTEELVRLPRSAWCYLPWTDAAVSDPPSLKAGHIMFGSLNNLAKITPRAIEIWARILHDTPGAKMAMLVQNDRYAEAYLTESFAKFGIGRERLIFHTQRPHKDYVELFSQLDIALDTFPYNGHTTTLNATWMGVPVVTVAGQTHVSRAGVSVLSTVGQLDLIAPDLEGYVKLAVELARDSERLRNLRWTLRAKMAGSPLLDAAGFTANLEREYRNMIASASR